jgi:ferredoxin
MSKKKSQLSNYFQSAFGTPFERPIIPLSRKQHFSTYWGRFIEAPRIFLLWILSKISPNAEKFLARKASKKWLFNPHPHINSLSKKSVNFIKEKKVEIDQKIDVQTRILDITTFNDMIDTFPFAEIGECGCRSVIKHCGCPTHTCLILRWTVDASKKLPNNKMYQIATREDIEKVMELSDKYSLIKMSLHRPDLDHIYTLCNCCDCCCIGFREFLVNAAPLIVSAKFVAKIDQNKCDGCFECINFRCRFRAIMKVNEDGTLIDPKKEDKERFILKYPKWSEDRRGWGRRIRKDSPSWNKIKNRHSEKWFAEVDPNRCFGCGNCASPKYGCPEGAIKLYPRESL